MTNKDKELIEDEIDFLMFIQCAENSDYLAIKKRILKLQKLKEKKDNDKQR